MSEEFIPEQSIGFLLNDVARLLRRTFNRRVQSLGLTQTQWQALLHIARNPGIRQGQLADILEVQPISVARLIDRMENAGWVERNPDPKDRRAINLFITDRATPLLTEMRSRGLEVRQQTMDGLTDDQQETIRQQLILMRENLIKETNGD